MPARVCILALLSLPALAQSWESLRELAPGSRVKVQDTAQRQIKGSLASVSAGAIAVRTGSGTETLEKARVRRVEVSSGGRRVRNALIGAAIGLGIAIAVDQTIGRYLRNETGESGRAVTFIAPIGGFAAVGALFPGYRTVYRAP